MGRHVAFFLAVMAVLASGCGGNDTEAESGGSASSSASAVADEGCDNSSTSEPELLVTGVVVEYADAGAGHIACGSGFDHSPPTSGAHFDAWQNCGFYTEPVRDDTTVHALEHGVVWISYQDGLAAEDVTAIEAAVRGGTHLLAAPYPNLKNPIVLSAWTRQLAVEQWSDPAVDEFLGNYTARLSLTAPEAGASCEGGVGSPPDRPDADYVAILEQVR